MEQERDVLAVKDARKFEVHCNAGDAGELCVGTESLRSRLVSESIETGSRKFGTLFLSIAMRLRTGL